MAAGTYAGSLTVSRNGTAANPIVIRGVSRDAVILNAAGQSTGASLAGDYTRLENLTVQGSDWGARVNDTTGVVIRGVRFTNVDKGIDGRYGTTRNLYLCDNVLEGRRLWPDFGNNVENAEGHRGDGAGAH